MLEQISGKGRTTHVPWHTQLLDQHSVPNQVFLNRRAWASSAFICSLLFVCLLDPLGTKILLINLKLLLLTRFQELALPARNILIRPSAEID